MQKHQVGELLGILKKEYGITTMMELETKLATLGTIDISPFCTIKEEREKENFLCTEKLCQKVV